MQLTFPQFDDAELALLRECLNSRWVTQGPFTRRFERLVAERQHCDFARATTSCTAALHLSVLALGLARGEEVIVPAFTWVTSAHCVEYLGARAVFADICADTFNVDVDAVASAITPRTRGIVAVHLFGLAADMDPIMAMAKKNDLFVVEDAACAIGTTYRDRPVGSIGDLGCFSFHPRKVVTTGEGGMVTTDSPVLARRVETLRNHGATGIPEHDNEPTGPWSMATFDALGYNLRLSDIQSAVGVAQMQKLDVLLSERRALAARYSDLLDGLDDLAVPAREDLTGHSFQSYVLRVRSGGRRRRNAVMSHLAERDIQTRPGTHAVHRLGYYRDKYGIRSDEFPVAALCEDTSITVPLFPGMTDDQQDRVVRELKTGLCRSVRGSGDD